MAPAAQRISRYFDLLPGLLIFLESALADFEADYAMQTKINWRNRDTEKPVAELHTKRSDGVEICLFCAPGEITLGRFATLGSVRSITPANDCDEVRIRLSQAQHVEDPLLSTFLIDAISVLAHR
jgi:hypothetical protein